MTTVNRITAVCATVAEMLEEAEPLQDMQACIERAGEINEDPNRTPWVGIYRASTDFEMRTIGFGAGHRKQSDELLLIAQEADGTSGDECEARLERLVSGILDALLSDPSLKGRVAMLETVAVAYDEYAVVNDEFFQSASIRLRVTTSTG